MILRVRGRRRTVVWRTGVAGHITCLLSSWQLFWRFSFQRSLEFDAGTVCSVQAKRIVYVSNERIQAKTSLSWEGKILEYSDSAGVNRSEIEKFVGKWSSRSLHESRTESEWKRRKLGLRARRGRICQVPSVSDIRSDFLIESVLFENSVKAGDVPILKSRTFLFQQRIIEELSMSGKCLLV